MPRAGHSRLFFALWPDDVIRGRLAVMADLAHAACGGRLMQVRNLHLTLAFLGDTADDRRAAAIEAARRVKGTLFELFIDRSGYFRQGRSRGVVWVGADAPAALVALSGELRAQLTASGVTFDAKPLVPHVTLLRDAPGLEPFAVFQPIAWASRDFVLVESSRDEAGIRYNVVERFPLLLT
jgi:2'-5' RNA ligase